MIYTRTSAGVRLRDDPSTMEREQLLARYYTPHHESLQRAVDEELAACGCPLIVDCPSRATD